MSRQSRNETRRYDYLLGIMPLPGVTARPADFRTILLNGGIALHTVD